MTRWEGVGIVVTLAAVLLTLVCAIRSSRS